MLVNVAAFATDPAEPVVFWLNVGQVTLAVVQFHVPVGVYDPPNSRMVSSASRTVLVRLLVVMPVTVNKPVCPTTDKLAAEPVVFWLSVGTSPATNARKEGAVGEPVVGPANT